MRLLVMVRVDTQLPQHSYETVLMVGIKPIHKMQISNDHRPPYCKSQGINA